MFPVLQFCYAASHWLVVNISYETLCFIWHGMKRFKYKLWNSQWNGVSDSSNATAHFMVIRPWHALVVSTLTKGPADHHVLKMSENVQQSYNARLCWMGRGLRRQKVDNQETFLTNSVELTFEATRPYLFIHWKQLRLRAWHTMLFFWSLGKVDLQLETKPKVFSNSNIP